MSRSLWKGPYVCPKLLKKVKKSKDSSSVPVKTWSRSSTIVPFFVGVVFMVYNGNKFLPVSVTEDMVGYKFGDFVPTRALPKHSPSFKVSRRK